jgi:thiamine-phosphate pyrophosphorylase
MLVTDRHLLQGHSLNEIVTAATKGGVNVVQLREKDLPAGELLVIASQLRRIVEPPNLLLVNDRLDVALAAGADGVELGHESLPVAVARQVAPTLLIGRSVHSLSEAVEAEKHGADFCIVGTMFSTRSHPGKEPEGPSLMEAVRKAVQLPLIGIGGITSDNACQVIRAGANGTAVISDIMTAKDPRLAADRLRRSLRAC